MKTYLFILTLLATAMNPVFSQKQLPPSIQPYASNLDTAVQKMLEAAGYDLSAPKAAFDLKPTIETRSDEPRLDSTITYHEYDFNIPDSLPLLRNIHTYPQPDTEVITEYFFDNDQWVPLSRTTLVSDDLGRLVNALTMVYNESTATFQPDSRLEFYPYENSMTEADSFFVFGWSIVLNDWHRLFAVWNRFDASAQLIESLSSTDVFDYPIVFLDRYFYNNDGDLASIESTNIDGGEEYPASRETFRYVDHLLQSSTLEVADGLGGFIYDTKIEYTYTSSRKHELVNTFRFDIIPNDWVLKHVLGYEYDSEERIILQEEVTATETGGWDRKAKTYAYFIDEHPSYVELWTFDFPSEQWIVMEKTHYYYSELTAYEPVDPVVTEVLNMWPNPSTGNVQLDVDGDASVHIYGASGQLLKQVEMHQGDDVLDVSSLPSGAYFVKAKTSDVFYSGQLIVQQ